MISNKVISVGIGKQLLDRLLEDGGDPEKIVSEENLGSLSGGDELETVVSAALEANPAAVEQIKAGKEKAIGPIIGYVMRETKGRADGGEVTKLVFELIKT